MPIVSLNSTCVVCFSWIGLLFSQLEDKYEDEYFATRMNFSKIKLFSYSFVIFQGNPNFVCPEESGDFPISQEECCPSYYTCTPGSGPILEVLKPLKFRIKLCLSLFVFGFFPVLWPGVRFPPMYWQLRYVKQLYMW